MTVDGSSQITGGAGTDTLATIENLTGGSGSDVLTGDASANALNGGDGDDRLVGLGGGDTLTGGNNGTAGDTASYAGSTAGGHRRR